MFEEESFIIKEKSCIVTSNKNIEYKIIFSIYDNDNINLTVYTTKLIPSKKFVLSCTLDELIKNRFFKLFINADEVFRELETKIENCSIVEETNIIYLDIPIGLNVINDIILEIKQLERNKDDIIKELNSEINNLKNNNNQLQTNLKNIENKFKITKEELESKVKELEFKLKEKEKEENVFEMNKSYIIKDIEKKRILKKWISENGKIKNINLLYRATEDGDSSKSFFNKCGNKGATISLIKTKKNRIFGGFTNAEWTDKKGSIKLYDKTAFLFSLDTMEKFKILKPELSIGCIPNECLLIYGNNCDGAGLYIYDNCFKNGGNENHETKVYDMPSDYYLTGENKFEIEEIEVYQIIFE